jgi:hypothetical protein
MPTRLRSGAAVRAALAGMLAGVLAGCAGNGGVVSHGAAPTAIPWKGPVYLMDPEGRPRRQPDLFSLGAKSSFDRIAWKHWGSPQTVGTGWEIDLACLSGCKGDEPGGYPATITLTALVRRGNAAYYSHASVTPVGPLPSWAENLHQVALSVPKH